MTAAAQPTKKCCRCERDLAHDEARNLGRFAYCAACHDRVMQYAIQPQTTTATMTTTTAPEAGYGYAVTATLFVAAAVALVGLGLYRMHAYETTDRIVGGDAYNYTILATRGVGWIVAGCTSAVLAAVMATFAVWAQLQATARGIAPAKTPTPSILG